MIVGFSPASGYADPNAEFAVDVQFSHVPALPLLASSSLYHLFEMRPRSGAGASVYAHNARVLDAKRLRVYFRLAANMVCATTARQLMSLDFNLVRRCRGWGNGWGCSPDWW